MLYRNDQQLHNPSPQIIENNHVGNSCTSLRQVKKGGGINWLMGLKPFFIFHYSFMPTALAVIFFVMK